MSGIEIYKSIISSNIAILEPIGYSTLHPSSGIFPGIDHILGAVEYIAGGKEDCKIPSVGCLIFFLRLKSHTKEYFSS